MKIRTKLSLQFISIVAINLILISAAIYFFSENHRKEDFYDRLHKKASNTAKLLIQVEEVDADLLRKIETDNPVSLPNERIVIYDYRNEILFSTDEAEVLDITPDMLDEIRVNEEVRSRQGDYEVLGFLFSDKYDRFVVFAGGTDIYGMRKMINLRNILIGVMSISIILLLVSGWIYAGRALRPISKIINKVNDISISSLNLRLDQGNNKDEIAELANTFNSMLDRLETAFKSQKNFISNASHELRTPLTAITGQLEVVLIKERSGEDYQKTIRSVLDDIRNLNSISNRLLLLAQASTELAELVIQPLRADEIIWQCREELLRRKEAYRIDVRLEDIDDEASLIIAGDENLVRTMIMNLMENGCKYSEDHQVEISLRSYPGNLAFLFRDKGIGIPEEDISHIFEPFRRGQNAQHIKGHGIGLSLVEKIVSLHKGTIEVSSAIDKGTIFTVTLPRK